MSCIHRSMKIGDAAYFYAHVHAYSPKILAHDNCRRCKKNSPFDISFIIQKDKINSNSKIVYSGLGKRSSLERPVV